MKKKSILVLILVLILVMALAFAGCGGKNDNGNGGDPGGNGNAPGENGDPGENGGNGDVVDIDWTDPDEVALAFLEIYAKGDFEAGLQFISYDAKFLLEEAKDLYAENPYILEFWQVVMTYSNADVKGRGETGNWMILKIELDKPDFESLMPGNEELFIDTMALLALSGVEMDDEILDYAQEKGMKWSEAAWNDTFAEFKSVVENAPTVKESIDIELLKVDEEWKIDSFPSPELF